MQKALKLLEIIKNEYIKILNDNLIGIYIHGSLAFKCFNWEKSDIDFLVIIKNDIQLNEKEQLIKILLDNDKNSPKKGFEMSVILEKNCINFIYPTPYILHYSNSYKEEFKNNLSFLCEKLNGNDFDLASHFTILKKFGFCIFGKNINEVFGDVNEEYYLKSILFDIENADKEIFENPVYFILNLCRVYAFIREKLILSKENGGLWGLKNLPEKYFNIINLSIKNYKNEIQDDLKDKKYENILFEFSYYLKQLIFNN